MVIQDSPDQSTELALALQKALNSNKLDTLYGIMDENISVDALDSLKQAVDSKKTVILHLNEDYGKTKVARYEIIIDFDKNEVHVGKINLEHTFSCSTFEVK